MALLGGSGAGKSTLMTALHDPNRLRGAGFEVVYTQRHLATPIGIALLIGLMALIGTAMIWMRR